MNIITQKKSTPVFKPVLTYAQTAMILGVDESVVYRTEKRAMEKLARKLRERGYGK